MVPVAVGDYGCIYPAQVYAHPGGIGQKGPGLPKIEEDLAPLGLDKKREGRLSLVVLPVDHIIVHENPEAHGPFCPRGHSLTIPSGPGYTRAHMLHLVLALALSAAPALVLLFWVHRRDKARPEPLGLVWKSALYGFLAVIPAAAIEILLGGVLDPSSTPGGRFLQAFLIAGLVEEGVKLVFLRVYLFRRPEFDERMDGIVYAICVSLGFAFVENFLYGYRDTSLLILRGFTSVPLHAIATGIMGYWLGRAKIDGVRDGDPRARKVWKRGLLLAVGFHGLYDFLLLTGSLAALLVFPLLILGWLGLNRLARKALALDSSDPRISSSQSAPGPLP